MLKTQTINPARPPFTLRIGARFVLLFTKPKPNDKLVDIDTRLDLLARFLNRDLENERLHNLARECVNESERLGTQFDAYDVLRIESAAKELYSNFWHRLRAYYS